MGVNLGDIVRFRVAGDPSQEVEGEVMATNIVEVDGVPLAEGDLPCVTVRGGFGEIWACPVAWIVEVK